MLAAVASVDVLDHLLAAVGLEVDVDVGRGGPFGRKEAFEDQVVGQRVDGGDAQQKSHQRVSSRAATLAADTLPAGEAHDVPDDKKIVGQAKLLDDRQLVIQQTLHSLAGCSAVALGQRLPAEGPQVVIRRTGAGRKERQILHAAAQGDVATLGDLQRLAQRVRAVGEKASHLGCALEMRLAVAVALKIAGVQSGVAADGGQHIVQAMASPQRVVDVVGGHHRRADALSQTQQSLHQPLVAGAQLALHFDEEAVPAEQGLQLLGRALRLRFVPGQQMLSNDAVPAAGERQEASAVLRQVVPGGQRLPLLAAQARRRDQLAEVGEAHLVLGEESQVAGCLPLTPSPSPPRGEGNRTPDSLSPWERAGVRDRLATLNVLPLTPSSSPRGARGAGLRTPSPPGRGLG